MKDVEWCIPQSVRQGLETCPRDRAVAVLLRHSVRGELPPRDSFSVPITEAGRRIALELGVLVGGRLKTLHTSPLVRCVQTAEALRDGAAVDVPMVPDRHLGGHGVYVLDAARAWQTWEELGPDKVVQNMATQSSSMPGMARPDEAARFLVLHMLSATKDMPGIHVFVSHDSLVLATAARFLGMPVSSNDWPWFLEGAFFWREGMRVAAVYRDHLTTREGPLCGLNDGDVLEFARREIGATVGFDSGSRFFLAGGAFKTLLTGRPPRDLDFWAPSEQDRRRLVEALQERGTQRGADRPFADVFELAGRVIEVAHKVAPTTLAERLSQFDITLSAVGVESRPDGDWSVMIHPLAQESVVRGEVRLLRPIHNWKYALVTLERMRRYGQELGYSVPAEEEEELWRLFAAQDREMRVGMKERFRRVAVGGFGVLEELLCRYP